MTHSKDTFDSEVDGVLEKYRYWAESIVLGTTAKIKRGRTVSTEEAKTKLRQIIKDRLPEKIVEFDTFNMLDADAGYRKGYNQALSDVISALGLEEV